ncbi:hypothetical protein C9374_004864 [Naegleria lovaniensis]|uniref:Uncharacterized protein n=1 Tax=Naegleria lovaniensis TaxID=51637 RepID=A0AA88GRB5_NAELO|nr:uncharacterized protein C9374_004864 [Naegleria lovaniensis]KAG2382897.1 hypothetical protein C9374_004864 [Naegleria lovaniensis]
MAITACCSIPLLKSWHCSEQTNHRVKHIAKYSIVLSVKMLFNALQWTGWLWAVTISEQVTSMLQLVEWRDVLVMFSISCNEILCSQLFGRILLQLELKFWKFTKKEQDEYLIGIYKGMLGCIASGITFDFVDRAAIKYFQKVIVNDSIVFLLRLLFVFSMDRAVFSIVIFFTNQLEYLVKIKETQQQPPIPSSTLGNREATSTVSDKNDLREKTLFYEFLNSYSYTNCVEGASISGYSAVLYDLATELASYICNKKLSTPNTVWIQAGVSSPFVLGFTGFAIILSMFESVFLFTICKEIVKRVNRSVIRICWSETRNDHS